MPIECELKYLNVDLDALGAVLHSKKAQDLGKYFESNLVFDDAERAYKRAGILLRLRQKQGKAVFTVKSPPKNPIASRCKIFEELETGVADFDTFKKIFEIMGLSVAFAYEKVRHKWLFMNCTICLDHLPFGDFVEIEGVECDIFRCADALEIGQKPTTVATYHQLNLDNQLANECVNESFVFSEKERSALHKETW